MDTYTYEIDKKLYINLTNRCSNKCGFCVRNGKKIFNGYNLFLSREPSAEEVLAEIKDPKSYKEIVFCGYGEPTYRLEVLLEVAKELKKSGVPLRLNTNGQGGLINKRNIAGELSQVLDTVSISLNAVTKEGYQKLCNSDFAEHAFDGIIKFASDAVAAGLDVVFTVVDILSPSEIMEAKKIAKDCGVKFRLREYIAEDREYLSS